MSQVNIIEIRCSHCKNWFKPSICFGDMNSFDTCFMEGNKEQCPHCNKMTDCNKENYKISSSDGGFIGDKT